MWANQRDGATVNHTVETSGRRSLSESGPAYFEAEVVHVFVGGAVDGAFHGELEGVKQSLTLNSEGAVQLE